MAINKLYVSHSKYKWDNDKSKLLDSTNLKKVLSSNEMLDYHTSINDIQFENIQKLVQSAAEIILVDLNLLTDKLKDGDYFQYGRLINELFRVQHKVKNFEWINKLDYNFFNSLLKQRISDNPVLWTLGCSVTYGVGVNYEQRWGSILSANLAMPEISLSLPGHSNTWCADQILRSDVKSGDIVVWGLTDISRVEYATNWDLHSIPITGYSKLPNNLQHYTLDYFDSQTKFVGVIKNILQVKNYCKKINAKLYLINLMDTTYFKSVFNNMPDYIDCAAERTHYEYDDPLDFIDLGSDNHHPGPKQHQYYAEQILNLIKENNHGKTI
jgi:hypothetical protein